MTNMKNLKVGDIIVSNIGGEAKVLEVFTNTFVRSAWNSSKESGDLHTFEEAEEWKWKIKGSKETVKEISMEVLEKYKKRKEEEGYIPTIEMLIEDLKNPTQ